MVLLLCMTVGVLGTSCTGSDGEMGPAGPQGEQGDKGDPGDPGQNPSMEELQAMITAALAEALPDNPTREEVTMQITEAIDEAISGLPAPLSEERIQALVDEAIGELNNLSRDDVNMIAETVARRVLEASQTPVSEEGCDTFVEGGRTYTASTGDDIICGDERRNRINANDGNDSVFGRGSNDTLNGERGDDKLYGGEGDDILRGGAGNDDLYGEAGSDDFEGGPGDDYMEGGEGNDTFWSLVWGIDDGSDDFAGGGGTDLLTLEKAFGAEDVDVADGIVAEDFDASADITTSNEPDFTINLSSGITDFTATVSDVFEGIENLTGSIYDDYLTGDSGDNVIKGLAGNDLIKGGEGDDTIDPGAGRNSVDGGGGSDTLVVAASTNLTDSAVMAANKSIENLQGSGSDSLTLVGDANANMITGGDGVDALTGGEGKDIFVVVKGAGVDTITDFSITQGSTDMIYFKGFGSGTPKVTVGTVTGDNDNLNVDGEAAVVITDAAAAVIVPNKLYKFVD